MTARTPRGRRVVVDGSNIATEGRSAPSLAQLDAAIRAFLEEYPELTTGDVTVVVDATFGHRIDPSERTEFDQAVAHGEIIAPPAGAVGRGDGFILRIAEKSDAIVLSNDSFQEFHGERPWLFDSGRLIGGKPVPGVGWVFTPRTPVRGPRSRSATRRSGSDGAAVVEDETPLAAAAPRGTRRAAKTSTGATGKEGKSVAATNAVKASKPARAAKPAMAAAKAAKPAKSSKPAGTAKSTKAARGTKAKAAKGTRTKPSGSEAVVAGKASPGEPAARKRAKKEVSAEPSTGTAGAPSASRAGDRSTGNNPLTFLNFVAEHPVGSTLEGTVVSFTSHGAYVDVEGMQAHVPLRGLGSPPPQRARHVLGKGERRRFLLVSLDAPRRRAELALVDQGLPKGAAETGR